MTESEEAVKPQTDETNQSKDETSEQKKEDWVSNIDIEDVLTCGIKVVSAAYGALVGWACGDKIKSVINETVNGSVDDVMKDSKK